MSNHNYSQYSSKKNNGKPGEAGVSKKVAKLPLIPADLETNSVVDEKEIQTPEVKMVVEPSETAVMPVIATEPSETATETVETMTLPETVKGIVTGCSRLNVRAYPSRDAEVVCVLDVMSELEINTSKSTYDWLSVCTATGIEGYCMKKFVDANL